MTPEEYMQIAIEEAKKGSGFTSPNPLVGAVLVKDGKIVGKDYHHKYGEFHAERNAILNCKEDLAGASLYVTIRAVLPLWKDASLHTDHHRKGDRKSIYRFL